MIKNLKLNHLNLKIYKKLNKMKKITIQFCMNEKKIKIKINIYHHVYS